MEMGFLMKEDGDLQIIEIPYSVSWGCLKGTLLL